MSRCAHSVPFSTNSRRNSAAVMAPPLPMPVFFMSAIGDDICSQYASSSGMRHSFSPAAAEASVSAAASASCGVHMPAMPLPSATMHAPVSVAMSTTRVTPAVRCA